MFDSANEVVKSWMEQQQKEGKLILPGELVRRVKQGPGLGSLGQAQDVARSHALKQQEIESDTRAIVARLEAAWSGQSGDAARGGLQPLAQVAIASSSALGTGQNTLTDQSHAFQSTRDSLQDVSDWPPTRDMVDKLSPWDTDTEDQINQRNAAVQRNNQIYQGFTSTSDGHAQAMPTEYGQMSDAQGDFTVGKPSATTNQQATSGGHSTFEPRSSSGPDSGSSQSDRASSFVSPSTQHYAGNSAGQVGNQQIPAAHLPVAQGNSGDGTQSAGWVPPTESGVGGGDANRFTPFAPGGSGSSSYGAGNGPGGSSGFSGGFAGGVPGAGEPGTSGRMPGTPGAGARAGGPGGPGRSTGSGRLGPVEEPVTRGGAGAAGARGANGMPMGAAGAGKGGKEEDKEKKSASYLLEPDPNALFGYDGKAIPPVIGK
ncbi:hypothetical protein G3I59_17810 [Amycolatopsis rubida]|uniref:PPE domain-containing protein n=1 Tax=Amycolatopsis rubida TaxID=112413 RepID=A0ABX0BX95_9PSEU|nr:MULTISPECIES: hypothetical protein [Amycolatopsis]MYW92412.1 hypothetical protein [Amycolatopsis rubida]NEC57400.1 hypothetical protein [Amycolatopsis rubida]OAP20713.1 hypothetical protein A4R44_08567 [Amycolatopsis sp. M39]